MAALCCLPGTAAANAGSAALGTLSPGDPGFTVGAGASRAITANLDNPDAGSVSINRYPVRLSHYRSGGPTGFLIVNAVYEYGEYDWSQAGLFNSTNRVALSAIGLRWFEDSSWGLFGFAQTSWAAETSGASLANGFSGTALAGPAYAVNPNLGFTGGLMVNTGPEQSTRVFPVASVNWRINPNWSLRTLNGFLLTYVPGDPDRWSYEFSGEYRTRGIRLKRQLLPDGSSARPAVEEREIALGVTASFQLHRQVTFQVFGEGLFARQWRFRADSSSYRTVKASDTLQTGFRVDYGF